MLGDAELVAVWRAAERLDAYGRLIRLLLVTGARLCEIADARGRRTWPRRGGLRLPADEVKKNATAG